MLSHCVKPNTFKLKAEVWQASLRAQPTREAFSGYRKKKQEKRNLPEGRYGITTTHSWIAELNGQYHHTY